MVLMRHYPVAVDLAQADREADTQLRGTTVGTVASAADDAVAEGDRIAGGNFQLAQMKHPAALSPVKELVPRFSIGIDPSGLQGRWNIEEQNVLCMVADSSLEILSADSGGPALNQGSNQPVIARAHVVLSWH